MSADDAPAWPATDTPLDPVNAAFHDRYDEARAAAESSAPVFVLIDESLVVCRRGERRVVPVGSRLFHLLKSAAHAPVALFVAVTDGRDPSRAAARLRALAPSLDAAAQAIVGAITDGEMARDAVSVLDASRSFLAAVLAGRAPDTQAFARATGPALLRLTDHATRVQLERLHDAVEEALATLTDGEQRALQVVVVGDHQARQRSLAMQYFRKRLGEPPGAEDRVAYAEGVADVEGALALVGTRRLDRAIARAFFADEKRLQRDVLGDAAEAHLRAAGLARIPG